jgi:uncharacterized protein
MSTGSPKSVVAQLLEAIKGNELDALTSLLRLHPDQLHYKTPFGGQTWLGYAASDGSLECVRHLVQLGFDINEADPREGRTPLSQAGYGNRPDVASYLLESGAAIDTTTSARNPLFAAIVGRSPAVVKLLLERGIDSTVRYNSKTMRNMDAVAFALMRGEKECAHIIALWNAKGDEAAAQSALREADEIAEDNAYGRKPKPKPH